MTYTQGPWHSDDDDNIFAGKVLLASVWELESREEKLANVHLIMTAPELLEALRKLTAEVAGLIGISEPEFRQLVGNTNVACLIQRFTEARDAITKAEGRT